MIEHPSISTLATLGCCRVVACEGWNVRRDETVELVFTTEGALLRRSAHGPALAKIEYREIRQLRLDE